MPPRLHPGPVDSSPMPPRLRTPRPVEAAPDPMHAPATSSPAAPGIRVRVRPPEPVTSEIPAAPTAWGARGIFSVILAWTLAFLSAASYVETWQRRNSAPLAPGAVVVRHP